MTQPNSAAPLPLCLIIGTYLGSADDVARVTPEHRAWLDQHYHSGTFLASGRQDPPVGGALVARGHKADLQALMQGDPFVKAGLCEYQFVGFTPVKRHSSFPYPEIDAVQ